MNESVNEIGSKQSRRLLNPLVFVSLVVTLVVVPVLVWMTRTSQLTRDIEKRRTRLQAVLQQTKELKEVAAMKDLRKKAKLLETQCQQVLSHCRAAADVPVMSKHLILSHTRSSGIHQFTTVFSVPEGQHELLVRVVDKTGDQKPKEYDYRIPLIAETGYLMKLDYDEDVKDGEPFSLQVRGNDEDSFEKTITFPIKWFDASSNSDGSSNVVSFPGEIAFADRNSDKAIGGPEVTKISWFGPGKRSVSVTVVISSDAKPSVGANQRTWFQGDSLQYAGDGRFDVIDAKDAAKP